MQRLSHIRPIGIMVLLFRCFFPHMHEARSVYRIADYQTPHVTAQWSGESTLFQIRDSHLEEYPIFRTFDADYFYGHMLPKGSINYRNKPTESVQAQVLNDLIEELILEIQKRKREYSHFTVLTRKNFNRRKVCGMMTLKFNDYPFILKLCIETPKTIMNPTCKGLDNMWFFPMGGGVNRHFAGFTRVKNREVIMKRIAASPYWSTIVDIPRKWHWTSKNTKNIILTGYNVGTQATISTAIPGTYAIVADAIQFERQFNYNKEDSQTALALCNYLDNWIDAHIDNFMIEKETGKLVIIDTEHFPTVIGMKEKKVFNNYVEWFSYLAGKCAHDWFFRTKDERIAIQKKPEPIVLA